MVHLSAGLGLLSTLQMLFSVASWVSIMPFKGIKMVLWEKFYFHLNDCSEAHRGCREMCTASVGLRRASGGKGSLMRPQGASMDVSISSVLYIQNWIPEGTSPGNRHTLVLSVYIMQLLMQH